MKLELSLGKGIPQESQKPKAPAAPCVSRRKHRLKLILALGGMRLLLVGAALKPPVNGPPEPDT